VIFDRDLEPTGPNLPISNSNIKKKIPQNGQN
jgi:hypothetical protein